MRHQAVDSVRFAALKNRLGCGNAEVIGLIEGVYIFASRHAQDGELQGQIVELENWLGLGGRFTESIEAMVEQNFLWRGPQGLAVSNWESEMPTWLKGKIALAKKRAAKGLPALPAKLPSLPIELPPQVPTPVGPPPGRWTTGKMAHEMEIPAAIDVPEVRRLWQAWLSQRFTAGRPVAESKASALLIELEMNGVEAAVVALTEAVKGRKRMIPVVQKEEPKPEPVPVEKPKPKAKAPPLAKFTPPTVAEVEAYCKHVGKQVDAELFVAHYESTGWKLKGGGRVVSWRACVVTWEKRQQVFNKRDNHGPQPLARDPYKALSTEGHRPNGKPLMLPTRRA